MTLFLQPYQPDSSGMSDYSTIRKSTGDSILLFSAAITDSNASPPANDPVGLESMPAEILHHIAMYTNFSTAHALSSTTRRLYHTFPWDRSFLKQLIRNSFYQLSVYGPSSWKHLCRLLDQASRENLLRLARAVEKADEVVKFLKPYLNHIEPEWFSRRSGKRALHNWLPHLIALEHPIIEYLDVSREFGHKRRPRPREKSAPSLSYDYCVIANRLARLPRPLHENEDRQIWFIGKTNYHRRFETFGYDSLEGELLAGSPLPEYSSMHIAFAFLEPSILGLRPKRFIPPSIPWPFTTSPREFAYGHLPIMTSPEYLTGDWIGYVTSEGDDTVPSVRHIPLSVHIFSRAPAKDEERVLRIKSPAKAIIGPSSDSDSTSGVATIEGKLGFVLSGSVHENGQVTITQTYRSGSNQHAHHNWYGWMTPFGMLGVRQNGLRRDFHLISLFWLWKKDSTQTEYHRWYDGTLGRDNWDHFSQFND